MAKSVFYDYDVNALCRNWLCEETMEPEQSEVHNLKYW